MSTPLVCLGMMGGGPAVLGVLGGVEAMNLYQEEDEYLQNQSVRDLL